MNRTEHAPALTRRYVLLLLTAFVAIAVDLATKQWALSAFSEGESVDVIGSLLQFTLVFNTGAAFSLGNDYTWVFTLIATAVVLIVAYVGWRVRSVGRAVACGQMVRGHSGNLV